MGNLWLRHQNPNGQGCGRLETAQAIRAQVSQVRQTVASKVIFPFSNENSKGDFLEVLSALN